MEITATRTLSLVALFGDQCAVQSLLLESLAITIQSAFMQIGSEHMYYDSVEAINILGSKWIPWHTGGTLREIISNNTQQ
ncbi:MAG TPA: hypothetical protein ENH10_02600 [Bacteroidetes bacterium]|nr:hypothetical protein [Bacteroidota bacterium]HEX04030.1 hypothetical protein [Bacteroidota bacterium]